MGFNSAFKGLIDTSSLNRRQPTSWPVLLETHCVPALHFKDLWPVLNSFTLR